MMNGAIAFETANARQAIKIESLAFACAMDSELVLRHGLRRVD
jgi:hypothetical protein